MGLLTALAITGVIAVATGATVGVYYATEDDRAKARIAEIDELIKNYKETINYFNNVKYKLLDSKSYLNTSLNAFANGGHSIDGKPLANIKFNDCIKRLSNAVIFTDRIISQFNTEISTLKAEKIQCQKKLE